MDNGEDNKERREETVKYNVMLKRDVKKVEENR